MGFGSIFFLWTLMAPCTKRKKHVWHLLSNFNRSYKIYIYTSAVHCGLTPTEGVKVEMSMINIACCQFPTVSELHGISINFPGISQVRYSSWIYMVI
jgi:hypothetical protein